MGTEYTQAHAAALAAQLPSESRTVRAVEPRAEWGWAESLLSAIEYNTRWLVWAQTKDGQRNAHKPKPLENPGMMQAKANAAANTDLDHIREVLGGPNG